MNEQSIRCKLCGQIGEVRTMALEIVDYSLIVDHGKICVSHADEPDDELAEKLGLSPRSTMYCDRCRTQLGQDDYEIIWIDRDSGIEVFRNREEALRHFAVEAAVEALIDAGIKASHEWRDHITFDLNGFSFHWGTTNATWGADVTGPGGCPDIGSIASCVPSDSTDHYLIFSAIYLRSTQFKGE